MPRGHLSDIIHLFEKIMYDVLGSLFKIITISLCMYGHFTCMHVCAPCVCLVPAEV